MKSRKFWEELQELEKTQLLKRLNELRREHFNLRCKKTTGQITDTSVLVKIKKNIARAETLLSMKRNDGN